jgi:hypothetical protein
MAGLLTDLGEEYLTKNSVDGISITVGLYDDSTDAISDSNDVGAISTEPGNANYARQSVTVNAQDISGDWGVKSASDISFDFSDVSTTTEIDSYFIILNFNASDTGDSSTNDHLVGVAPLSKTYDVSNHDTLTISSGTIGLKVN